LAQPRHCCFYGCFGLVRRNIFDVMEKHNRKYIWSLIKETGDFLVGKLPEHPYHRAGRNPYAHVASRIKKHFHQSYKDLSDDKIGEIIEYLKMIKKEEG